MCKKREEFFKQVRAEIDSGVSHVQFWQRKPYTACKIRRNFGSGLNVSEGLGFCRCNWRDWFRKDLGREIALGRAIQHLWEQGRTVRDGYSAEGARMGRTGTIGGGEMALDGCPAYSNRDRTCSSMERAALL